MASQGPTLPGTGTNVATVGTVAWTNPGNITANDSAYAEANSLDPDSGLVSDNIVRLVDASGTIVGTDKAATGVQWVGGVFTTASYGGSSDLWGTTWTPTDINNTNFGAVLSAIGISTSNYLRGSNFGFTIPVSATINGILLEINKQKQTGGGRVDFYKITVYYTDAATGFSIALV